MKSVLYFRLTYPISIHFIVVHDKTRIERKQSFFSQDTHLNKPPDSSNDSRLLRPNKLFEFQQSQRSFNNILQSFLCIKMISLLILNM